MIKKFDPYLHFTKSLKLDNTYKLWNLSILEEHKHSINALAWFKADMYSLCLQIKTSSTLHCITCVTILMQLNYACQMCIITKS